MSLTKRDQAAAAVYAVYTNKCLVPFADAGDAMRAHCYALVDAAWDPLTAPPTEAMVDSARQLVRMEANPEEIWEAMVATMIAESKP